MSYGQIMTQYQIILLYEHFQNIKNTYAHSDILRPSKWDRSNSRLVWAATSQSWKQYIKHQTTNHFVSSGYGLVFLNPKWIASDPPNHDLFLLFCRSKMVQTESPTKFCTSRGPNSAPRHFSISNLDCSNCSWWTIPSWWIFFLGQNQ